MAELLKMAITGYVKKCLGNIKDSHHYHNQILDAGGGASTSVCPSPGSWLAACIEDLVSRCSFLGPGLL